MVGKINIKWTSFEHEIPNVVSESSFDEYKVSQSPKLVTLDFQFFKVFYKSLIIIGIAILFAIFEYASILPRNGMIELFVNGYYVIVAIVLLSFVPSAISFLSAYFHTKSYINNLSKNLDSNTSYKEFCTAMGYADKRYLMLMQRLNTQMED